MPIRFVDYTIGNRLHRASAPKLTYRYILALRFTHSLILANTQTHVPPQ